MTRKIQRPVRISLTQDEAELFKRLCKVLIDGPDCPHSLVTICTKMIDYIEAAQQKARSH